MKRADTHRLRKTFPSLLHFISKNSLNLLWRYSESEPHTAGRKTASDLIGGGMCQIVVELYVKVGQRTEGKYWFLGRFT